VSRLRAVMGDLGFPRPDPVFKSDAMVMVVELGARDVERINAAIAEDDRALWTPGQDIDALLHAVGAPGSDPEEIRRLLRAAHDLCGAFREFADGFQARLAAAMATLAELDKR
jgi:hypothetical protein